MKLNFWKCMVMLHSFMALAVSSCGIIRKSSKNEFTDGFYSQIINNKKKIVYVDIEDDILHIHLTKMYNHKRIIDTAEICQVYQKEMKDDFTPRTSFSKYSFDIDFLTMPLKYRPSQDEVSSQLNANLNGALYFGFRTDNYKIRYVANPLKKSDRTINHYGFSVGAFTGLGNTAMTPTTTHNNIAIEYDGIVWTKGIAGIIAVNNFTVGLSLGFDNLLDKNKKYWIYETKPWFGLAVGLNLN